MALLPQAIVLELVDTILDTGIDTLDERRNFFLAVNSSFFTTLQRKNSDRSQLISDIGKMNERERLADGQVPLLIYLENVVSFAKGLTQEKRIREIMDMITQKSSGAKLPDLTNVPELKEAIIHTDDTVTYQFIKGGFNAAESVVKLLVPSFENMNPRMQSGSQMFFNGTGWLLSDSLLITNHHVINARMDEEAPASVNDLKLQGKGTTVIFDYDAEGLQGNELKVTELLGWNSNLDYAVLRIPSSGRKPLRCATVPLSINGGPTPVNIVQHPNGNSKRYGIRNNLVSGTTATDLRYFTDTDRGSSGSPVFTDQWQVVALHRAAVSVSGVNFQGKTTAYVNVGTHISLVLDDIRARYPELANELS